MPQNKRMLFPQRQQEVATAAQVLGHPARLQILKLLRQHRFLMRDEVAAFLPLTASTVSQHLAAMVQAGVLCRTVDLGVVGYIVDEAGWRKTQLHIKQYFAEVGKSVD